MSIRRCVPWLSILVFTGWPSPASASSYPPPDSIRASLRRAAGDTRLAAWQREAMVELSERTDGTSLDPPGLAEGTWSEIPATAPMARAGSVGIYDPRRDRVLFLGGSNEGFATLQVWQLSLGDTPSWTRVVVAGAAPSRRERHSAAYDKERDRVVVFGGFDGSSYLDDLWVLELGDVPRWHALTAEGPPPKSRAGATLVIDPAAEEAVLFGGYDGSISRNDLWRLMLVGAARWRQVLPLREEAIARTGHALVCDARRDRVVMFGGRFIGPGAAIVDEFWELSLQENAWTRLEVEGDKPSPRTGHSAILDAARDRMIVFGGFRANGSLSDEVFVVGLADGSSRRLAIPPGPSARYGHTAVYDPQGDRMVVWGGTNGTNWIGDAWSLSLGDSPQWTYLAARPAVAFHAAVCDTSRRNMIVFGVDGRIWSMDLATNGWLRIYPDGIGPGLRSRMVAVHDAANDRIVVQGGVNDFGMDRDAWALSLGPRPTWTRLPDPPYPNSSHAAIYDGARQRMIVCGGTAGASITRETLALELGAPAWTTLVPAHPCPDTRAHHSAALDAEGRRMLVFGGRGGLLLDDVWALPLNGEPIWQALAGPGERPASREGHCAVIDPITRRMIVFGGGAEYAVLNDVWELPLDPPHEWRRVETAGAAPSPRFLHAAAYDATRDRMIVYGGGDWGSARGDAWALHLKTRSWAALAPDAVTPGSRGRALYDETENRFLVFEGSRVLALVRGDEQRWVALPVAGDPPRSFFDAVYVCDPPRDRVLVTASYRGVFGVWQLTLGDTLLWSPLTTAGDRLYALNRQSLVHDPRWDQMLLFGGSFSDGDLYSDALWTLSLGKTPTWTRLAARGPLGRAGHAAAWDPALDQMIVQGGYSWDMDDGYRWFDDGWSLTPGADPEWKPWARRTPSISARYGHGIQWDAARKRFLVFGGTDRLRWFDDVWLLDGARLEWTRLEPAGTPPSVLNPAMAAWDPIGDRLLAYDRGRLWQLRFGPGTSAVTTRDPMSATVSPIGAMTKSGGRTVIELNLAETRPARLELFDIAGRRLAHRDVATVARGANRITLDEAGDLRPGVYLLRLTQGERATNVKRVLLE